MYVIFIFLSIIICFSFIVVYKRKQDKNIQQLLQKRWENYLELKTDNLEKHFDQIAQLKKIEFEEQYGELQKSKNLEIENLDQQLERMKTLYTDYEASEKEKVKSKIECYEKTEKLKMEERLKEEFAKNALASEEATKALIQLKEELDDFQEKQKAINEEIMRRREMEEKKDFYRIILQPEALSDIEILKQTRKNLKKPEIIDKVIYDNYIAKPVLEMVKRVLQNTTYCGIYKITCLITSEVYIGKSTDIKSRWQQHCKSAFNCGTIASSLLHTKMKQYGIENFTFELLEKVPKENLSEREKYYINFYQTKEVGLNERNG